VRRRVGVIGGGISGLTAAYRLIQAHPGAPIEVVLFESQDRLGGVIQTDRSQGVVLEGGPDSFLRRKPEAISLAMELGLEDRLMSTNPQIRGSYIFHQGHFYDIPPGVRAGVPTRIDTLWGTEILSLGEKMRIWGDLVLPRRRVTSDVALGSLLRYRFGRGYVERIAAPLLAGIYAGDIDQLSTAATAPELLLYQSRGPSLIREAQRAIQSRTTTTSSSASVFASLSTGVATLVEALAAVVRERAIVHVSTPVTEVLGDSDAFQVKTAGGLVEDVTDVVAAVPAYQASSLLTGLSEEARAILKGIDYADLAVVGAVYRTDSIPRSLTRTGFLVPRGEGLQMTAATFVRAKWDYPDSTNLVPIRGFFGRAGQASVLQKSDDEIAAIFREEMGFIMGITDAPLYTRVFRIPQGMPQYHVGHRARMDALQRELQSLPHLKLIGAYFDGVGVPDCIRHATQAVKSLLEDSVVPATH
jgi:oxygen-dependent protoporphyrinogen oxidase